MTENTWAKQKELEAAVKWHCNYIECDGLRNYMHEGVIKSAKRIIQLTRELRKLQKAKRK